MKFVALRCGGGRARKDSINSKVHVKLNAPNIAAALEYSAATINPDKPSSP
jgi:hypothetical protein